MKFFSCYLVRGSDLNIRWLQVGEVFVSGASHMPECLRRCVPLLFLPLPLLLLFRYSSLRSLKS